MNEITQYIQKLEARYEEVKNEKTWYDSCEYRREGREIELEDVISELKEVVAAFKARLNKQADSYPNIVKAHIRATTDSQPNQTDGGALCDAACSASSLLCGGATEPDDILDWIGSKLEPIGFVRKSSLN